jgi:GT2 family glycosyltransferase
LVSHGPNGSTTVIVCAYTLDRLEQVRRCLRAVLDQRPAPDQVVVVVDHNEQLRDLLASEFPAAEVVANAGARGLSAARNTGIHLAGSDLIAFIDDDAAPEPGWLAALTDGFRDARTMGVGGHAVPAWEASQPGWFPDEYLWVVGCSYAGQRTSGRVRNPIGCNMAFRRRAFEAVGGFSESVGRLGTLPLGAEETEFCVRLTRAMPEARIAIATEAVVHHSVPASRGTLGYFVRRCFYEGISKAVLRHLSDGSALAPEGEYVLRTLTGGSRRRLAQALRLREPGRALASTAALWLGLVAASAGYLFGRVRGRRSQAGPVTTVARRRPADGPGAGAA